MGVRGRAACMAHDDRFTLNQVSIFLGCLRTAKFRECRFYFFPAGDFAARYLAKSFVDRPKLLGSRVIHATPARVDVACNLSQFLLVLLGPSFHSLEQFFGALIQIINISQQLRYANRQMPRPEHFICLSAGPQSVSRYTYK